MYNLVINDYKEVKSMENMKLFDGLELFYKATGCFVSVYDRNSEEFIWSCSEEFNVFFHEAINRPYILFNTRPTTYFINGFELVGGFNYSDNGRTYTAIIGPSFVTDPFTDLQIIGKTLYFATGGDTNKLKNYLYVSKITDKEGFKKDLFLCYYLFTGNKFSDKADDTKIIDINKDIIKKLFEMREKGERDYFSFERQELFLSAVGSGNIEKVRELCNAFINFKAFKRCDDSLFSCKIRFITAMILFERKAISSGVDEEIAAVIYKEFCRKICSSEKEWEIKELFLAVALEYTKNIRDLKIYKIDINDVNHVVVKAVDFISRNLHNDINIADICSNCGVSESYLRIRFKHDVGKSIVEYINEQKIEEAKMLLKYTDYSLMEISEYLSFSSQSYFTTVFKKNCGQTPAEYKNLFKL